VHYFSTKLFHTTQTEHYHPSSEYCTSMTVYLILLYIYTLRQKQPFNAQGSKFANFFLLKSNNKAAYTVYSSKMLTV